MNKSNLPPSNRVFGNSSDPNWINDRYKILKRLGSGGSSKVYAAIDKGDLKEPEVAIKLLGLVENSESFQKELFERELQALSSLSNPGIVSLLDYGDDKASGHPYLVLEYVENARTLLEQIASWRPSLYSAVEFTIEILEALAYAHDAHIIHRDLNPSNILIDKNGYAKIIDFGISKILGELTPGRTVREFFTRAYASPEQIAQTVVSYPTDIYSVAGIFYFLLKFRDPDPRLPLAQHFDEINDLPIEIQRVAQRMAAASVAERYSDVHQLIRELKSLVNSLDTKQNRFYVMLSKRVVGDLYSQTILKTDSSQEAKTIVQAALDSGVFLQRDGDTSSDRYELFGDSFILKCSVSPTSRLGNYSHFFVTQVIAKVAPHSIEKQKQQAMLVHATWMVGMENDPAPTRFSKLEGLIDDLDKYRRIQAIQLARRQRRADLIDTWRGILKIDREIRQQGLLQLDYDTWDSVEDNQVIKIHLTREAKIEELLDREQLLSMQSKQGREIAVGHYLRYEGNDVFLSRLPSVKLQNLSVSGKLAIDQRQWAAAWNRQWSALDTLMDERCVNPNLPNILLNPKQARKLVSQNRTHYYNADLDHAKKAVVDSALAAGDLYLIQGPPGTGKTVVISEMIAQILNREPKAHILLVSQSNVAVDNVVARVGELLKQSRMVRVGQDNKIAATAEKYRLGDQIQLWIANVQKRSSQFLQDHRTITPLRRDLEEWSEKIKALQGRIGQEQTSMSAAMIESQLVELKKRFPDRAIELSNRSLGTLFEFLQEQINLQKSDLERVLEEWMRKVQTFDLIEDAYLQACSIVAGTCVGIAGKQNLPDSFDWVIVDEAGRATPSEVLIPLVRGRRAILVGDHKQLPPVLEHDVKNEIKKREEYDAIWADLSLFEYLFTRVPDSLKSILRTQYRMHPDIAELIRNVFYREEELESGVSADERFHGWKRWPRPVVWLSTSSLENRFEEIAKNASRYNVCEVSLIARELAELERDLQSRGITKTVAVISGYSEQVGHLKRELNPQNTQRWKSIHLEVNTVDAFQGREVDILFYSVVRSNRKKEIGFLSDMRRLNVALSRGKELLFIVGDDYNAFEANTRDGLNPFKEVIVHIQSHPESCLLVEEQNDSSRA